MLIYKTKQSSHLHATIGWKTKNSHRYYLSASVLNNHKKNHDESRGKLYIYLGREAFSI